MAVATDIALAVCIVILLPLSFFRRTRAAAAFGFMISSFVFGVCLWMYGLLVTMGFWGVGAVVIGLMLGGVGVVPIEMLASISTVNGLLVGTALTFLSRFLAVWLGAKVDAAEYERQNRVIEGSLVR